MAREYAPNTLDGPPPAKLKKATSPPDKDLPSDIAKNPATSAMIGQKMVEQGLLILMGTFPELRPAYQLALQELKKMSVQGIAALASGPAGPGMGAGGPMDSPMAAGMVPQPGMAPPGVPGAAPGPVPGGGMPIPPGV